MRGPSGFLPFLMLAMPVPAAAQQFVPPPTRTADVVDDYHGTRVPDPYRWLEDTESAETAAWVEAQNAVTFAWLGAIPERTRIRERLTQLWDYERYSTPWRRGTREFWFRNDGLQNQSVLYTAEGGGPASVLLDPNTLSTDGTTALTMATASRDGRLLAWGFSEGGSDWQQFRVRDIATGEDLPDRLAHIKFSGASWTHDGRGFFYSRYPEPEGDSMLATNRNQRLYYHRLGTPQADDRLIHERPDEPEWGFGATVTDDGRYAVINAWVGTDRRNRVYLLDLEDAAAPSLEGAVTPLQDRFDAAYSLVGNVGSRFYFRTDLDAPRGRLIAFDVARPGQDAWTTVVPEADDVLSDATIVGGRLVLEYLHDAHSVLRLAALDGTLLGDVPLPTLGTVAGVSGLPDDPVMHFAFTSFLYPTTVYRYDVDTGELTTRWAPEVDFDASPYVTEQVFYESKDGTRVPMFITHRRDLVRDGTTPTYLYGYGGFNVNLLPGFTPSYLVWLEMGGAIAIPNLRGGAEYGEAWHRAGMLEQKQNVFDDFIAAAEWLIAQRYTRPERLAIAGGSNGGLLVGAAMTQRPELFAAALPAVGVMDMLRYHKFTIGWAWVPEYGSADDPEQFAWLRAYSPLHNLVEGTDYPATMITTADHDDRVVPGHSFKFAAALQAATTGARPAMIRIDVKAGHGAGKPTAKVIEEHADRWAFLHRSLRMDRMTP